MGCLGIIARRREDGTVQYGFAGNGAYFRRLGRILLWQYDTPEDVSGLFESETPAGEPYCESDTERSIFSQIAFIDHGYFYDTDGVWYHVNDGPFRIKSPLELVGNNLDRHEQEYDFLAGLDRQATEYVVNEYPKSDPEFAKILSGCDLEGFERDLREKTLSWDSPMEMFYNRCREAYDYLDDWIVAVPDDECRHVTGFLVRKRERPRPETIDWPGHPDFRHGNPAGNQLNI